MNNKREKYITPHVVIIKLDIAENCMITYSILKEDGTEEKPSLPNVPPGMAGAPKGWYSEEEEFPME